MSFSIYYYNRDLGIIIARKTVKQGSCINYSLFIVLSSSYRAALAYLELGTFLGRQQPSPSYA